MFLGCITIHIQYLIPRQDRVNATLRRFESDDCVAFWVTNGCNKEFLGSFYAGT